MRARVYVTLKPAVLDAQGEAVKAALGSLGFDGVDDVRVGRFIELKLEGTPAEGEARERVSAMCEQLLANPVIESYRVEVDPS